MNFIPNYEPYLNSLLNPIPKPRQELIQSNLVLSSSLPSFSNIESTAYNSSIQARKDYILRDSLRVALTLDALPAGKVKKTVASTPVKQVVAAGGGGGGGKGWRGLNANGKFEEFQVFKAIEVKDIMLLMEIRDSQFELLVQAQKGGTTPLLHAMRMGKSHRDLAILLTGAISREVNNFSDEELSNSASSATKAKLRAIKTNLKLAISYGLESSQSDLIASYLQISLMSEGTPLLLNAISTISLAVRAGATGKPVENAEKLFSKWVGRELKEKNSGIASVSEFISNAVSDLVLLAMWSVVTDTFRGDNIPLWFFARDDRITKALEERLDELRKSGDYSKISRGLRKQLEVALSIMSKRNIGGRERLIDLKSGLDGVS